MEYARPGDIKNITCAVDNTGVNPLTWMIPSFGNPSVQVSNLNGVDGVDGNNLEFKSIVNNFDNIEDTTNATLSFPAMESLDGAVVMCADNTEVPSSCTLFILSKGN